MRKLLKVALVALGVVFMSNFAQAQAKVGYVSIEQVLQLMPEAKTVQTNIETYQQQFVVTLQGLQKEFDTKLAEYNAKRATMTDAVRTVTESELQSLQQRSTETRDKAQQQVEAKGQELMRPLYEKVKVAINAVAKEKGYTHVLNATTNDLLLVAPPADDLLAAVKLKLGLK